MLTKKEEDTASVKHIAKARPRRKRTVTLTFVSVPVLKWKWIDIETQRSHDHKCYEVSKAMTRLLRHDQSLEEATEQSTTVTSSTSAGGRSSTMLRSGYLEIGYQLWQNEERRKDFNIARIQTLPINSCTFTQFKDMQEIMLLILHCKTMYYYRKDLPSTSTTSGTRIN